MRSSTARVGGDPGGGLTNPRRESCRHLRSCYHCHNCHFPAAFLHPWDRNYGDCLEILPPGVLLSPRGNARKGMIGHSTSSRRYIYPHFPPAQTRLGTLSVPCSTQWSPLPQPVPPCCQIPSLPPLGVPGVPVTSSLPGTSSRPSADYLLRSFSCTRQRKSNVPWLASDWQRRAGPSLGGRVRSSGPVTRATQLGTAGSTCPGKGLGVPKMNRPGFTRGAFLPTPVSQRGGFSKSA